MAVKIRLSGAEVARVRFALSPLAETVLATRVLLGTDGHAVHGPWARRARPALAGDPDLPLLSALLSGCTPSFLFPVPATRLPALDTELDRVRSTAPDFFLDELTAAFGARSFPRLRADPVDALNRIAGALERCHRLFIEPRWERIRAIMEADLAHRGAILTGSGVEGVVSALHRDLSWRDGELIVRRECSLELGGHDLVLSPSVFLWARTLVDTAPIDATTIHYPARGAGRLWETPGPLPKGVSAVLGRTKAAVLEALSEPLTTAQLAVRLALTPSAVSQHLGALRDADLIVTHRRGRTALHVRTERGSALVGPGDRSGA
ncbi:DUF5937 family protein [Actinoallomurus vinaceus]|uniref:DUF5937 family protein n=1 Tax=Actinoallomurus vinaceus TaxID=1080074 RepID=A0ABP8UAT3_9ACTN